MSRTFRGVGSILTFIAPSGGVVGGTPLMIGAMLVIPQKTKAEGLEFEGETQGIHELPKTSAQAWADGDRIFFNTSTSKLDSDGTTGPLVGVACEGGAANPSAVGMVRLNGTVPGTLEGAQAHIADLVAITGGETPTEAEHNLIIAKVNTLLAELRLAGILKTS
jgi:predicted RecA/RadA family phage recombinase